MTETHSFWTFNLGHLLTIIGLLITLLALHTSNIKRIKEAAVKMQSIEDSISRLLRMEDKLSIIEIVSTKLDIIYPVIIEALRQGKLFNHGK